MNDSDKKLVALCEGLGVQNLNLLLLEGNVDDFYNLGELIAKRVEEIKSTATINALRQTAHILNCDAGEIKGLVADALNNVADEIERNSYIGCE